MPPPASSLLPQAPAIVAGHGRAALLSADGELLTLSKPAAARQLDAADPPLVVHAPATLRRLGASPMPCLDLLQLFAFVMPARTAPPTPAGLAAALDLRIP
ncbi:MAG: ATP-dependent DNA helicase, partial [Sphingomonas sp.]